MLFDPAKVPGYLDAVEREKLVRNVSFLPITLFVEGFELCQMTLNHWLLLYIARSPMVFGGIPRPDQAAQFLWVMNPDYNPEGRGKRALLRRCRKVFRNPSKAQRLVAEINRYMHETMLDLDRSSGAADETSYFADPCYLVGMLCFHFGWSEDAVMRMPLARIFQYKKVIKLLTASSIPLGNPSERLISDWLNNPDNKGRAN